MCEDIISEIKEESDKFSSLEDLSHLTKWIQVG